MCFPEAYLPGLRGLDFEVPPFDPTQQERALRAVAQWARTYQVATVLGMEWLTNAGRQIAAVVLDARGEIQGCQTKNQLDPTEEPLYVPGHTRQLFEVKGLKFGVAIWLPEEKAFQRGINSICTRCVPAFIGVIILGCNGLYGTAHLHLIGSG